MRGLDPRTKPQLGTYELDRSHQLAQGLKVLYLFNEGGGSQVVNTVTGRSVSYHPNFRPRYWGVDARSQYVVSDIDQQDKIVEAVTVSGPARTFLLTLRPMALGGSGPGGIMMMYLGDVFNTGTVEGLNYRSANQIEISIFGSDLAYNFGTSTTGKVLDLVGTRTDAGGRDLYAGGILMASDTTSITFTGSNKLTLGALSGFYYRAAFWDRALSADEVAWLSAEPFAMLRGLSRTVYTYTQRTITAGVDSLIPTTARTVGV